MTWRLSRALLGEGFTLFLNDPHDEKPLYMHLYLYAQKKEQLRPYARNGKTTPYNKTEKVEITQTPLIYSLTISSNACVNFATTSSASRKSKNCSRQKNPMLKLPFDMESSTSTACCEKSVYGSKKGYRQQFLPDTPDRRRSFAALSAS